MNLSPPARCWRRIEDNEASLAVDGELELEIARRIAGNNVGIRFARKSLEVARAELQRCLDSVRKAPQSVSGTELDRLRLLVEKLARWRSSRRTGDAASAESNAKIKENDYRRPWRSSTGIASRLQLAASWCGSIVSRGEWVNRATRW